MKILSAVMAGGAAVAAAGLIRSGYERRHFVTEEITISSKKIRNPRTLVFLTDLHDKEFGDGNEQLLIVHAHMECNDALLDGKFRYSVHRIFQTIG